LSAPVVPSAGSPRSETVTDQRPVSLSSVETTRAMSWAAGRSGFSGLSAAAVNVAARAVGASASTATAVSHRNTPASVFGAPLVGTGDGCPGTREVARTCFSCLDLRIGTAGLLTARAARDGPSRPGTEGQSEP
jgi:hypothetical protein